LSQIYKNNGGGGGGGSVSQVNTQSGNAVPAAGILLFNGYDTTENNIFGIETKGGTNAGNPPGTGATNEEDVYLTNRFHGTLTTVDNASHTISTLPITITNGVTRIKVIVVGYNTTGNIAATTEINASYRQTAGSNTLLPNNYFDIQEDLTFVGSVFTVGTTPGSILVTVAGQAANTINWVCIGTYVQVGT